MGICFGAPLKSQSPSITRPSRPGTRTGSITTTTGKLSSMSSSNFGPSTGSGTGIDDVYPDGRILEVPNLRIFTFAELKSATRNFKSETVLGEAGFGRVYKGWVDERTLDPTKSGLGRMVIAVKKLKEESRQGLEQWQSEVNFLGRLSHPNLIKLLGYCQEGKELLLVYEFMEKGSLKSHLFRGASFEPLSWSLRLKIVIGAARALAFLHTSEKQVIYRNFKPSKILLDSNYNPKLSGFVLARNGPTSGDSHVSTRVMGTIGYAAPEYVTTGHLYVKSDVYGFGVVLLEVISGQRAIDANRPSGQHSLLEWAEPCLSAQSKLHRLMDPQLKGQYPSEGSLQTGQLARRCLAGDPRSRPSMTEVVETLESIEAMKV